MNFVQSAAVRLLRGDGFRVFLPLLPPPAGSLWVPGPPGKGKRKRRPSHAATLPRAAFEAAATHVIYGHGNTRATITLGTWHRWRTRTRAKMQIDP